MEWQAAFVVLMVWSLDGTESAVGMGGSPTGLESMQNSNALTRPTRILSILPAPSNPHNMLIKRVDETLNLTCVIEVQGSGGSDSNKSMSSAIEPMYKLAWVLPMSHQSSKQRTEFIDDPSGNFLTILLNNLKESDTGDYTCEAAVLKGGNPEAWESKTVRVIVKQKRNTCAEVEFPCSTGECIPKRYVCDGRPDCKEGSDESRGTCGLAHPCDGKLRCEDGRCISKNWCCDRSADSNCTIGVIPQCCKGLYTGFGIDLNPYYTPQSHHLSDMGFLQTTIYTVIGCAMAFMFIITIMVIAICRVHLKRTSLPRYPHNASQTNQREDSWGNVFLQYSGSPNVPCSSSTSGLLVTYNINNGVQFLGRPQNPPPYSEVVRAPPKEGPPPPYASEENLAITPSTSNNAVPSTSNGSGVQAQPAQEHHQVYLEEDDPEAAAHEALLADNNNGDINGNSTMAVQVEPNSNPPEAASANSIE